MSQEDLDLVRSICADWERADFSRADWADPEIEFVMMEGAQAGAWTGLAAMAEAWGEWLGVWATYRSEAQAFRELSDGRVLVLNRSYARRGASTAEVTERAAVVFEVRRGLVTRLMLYSSREGALADLGLEG